jgi:molybdate transport system substrate-binding protein
VIRLSCAACALLLATPLLAVTARAADSPLTVFAASSLAEAFREVGARLEADRPGLRVRFNFAGSQQLAAQIEQGAAADVFASADERWMRYVVERDLAADSARVFAHNRLVVIVPRTNPARIRTLPDLARRGIKLVLAAEAVPAGAYSRQMLRALGRRPGFDADFAARVLRNVVSDEENVRAVLGKVQLGEADAGVVYRSDIVGGARRSVTVLEVPADAGPLAHYPLVALRGGHSPGAARTFVALVLSPWGQETLERHGFTKAP